MSRDRACAGPISPMTATIKSGRIIFIPCPRVDGSGLGGSALARLQGPAVFDHLIDLRVGEGAIECRHRALLTVLDAVTQKVIVALRIHQLRPLAGSPG